MTPLYEALLETYIKLMTYVPGTFYDMQPNDIKVMCQQLPASYPLQPQVVKNLAEAFVNNDIGNNSYNKLNRLQNELPDSWNDWTEAIQDIEFPPISGNTQQTMEDLECVSYYKEFLTGSKADFDNCSRKVEGVLDIHRSTASLRWKTALRKCKARSEPPEKIH